MVTRSETTSATRNRLNGKNTRATQDETEPDLLAELPSQDFPEVDVGKGLTVQLCFITSERAAEWLKVMATKQRKKKAGHLACLIDDMKSGRFRLNGETIVFDDDGFLIDGQHRLTACVETGRPFYSLVVRGVEPDSFTTIDITAKRSGSDALKVSGHINTRTLAAAAGVLWRYERGSIFGTFQPLSPPAIQEVVNKHPGLVRSVSFIQSAARICQATGVPAFCHYKFSTIDHDAADDFFSRVATGEMMPSDHPVMALRRRLMERRFAWQDIMFMIFKAWNAYRQGRNIKTLRIHEGEKFPQPI